MWEKTTHFDLPNDRPSQTERGDHIEEIASHQYDVGCFDSDGGSRRESDSYGSCYECWRVVDSVSDLKRNKRKKDCLRRVSSSR